MFIKTRLGGFFEHGESRYTDYQEEKKNETRRQDFFFHLESLRFTT